MKIKLITFRELLNLIHEGKQPNKVWLSGTNLEWEWESADEEYYWRDVNGGIEFVTDIVTLEEFVSDRYNAKQLAEKKIIGFFDDILTDKEKEYLSNIIKPFKKYVISIAKRGYFGQDRIEILYKDDFVDRAYPNIQSVLPLPSFRKNSMYTGMEVEKAYTLEELGL